MIRGGVRTDRGGSTLGYGKVEALEMTHIKDSDLVRYGPSVSELIEIMLYQNGFIFI